MDFYIKGKITGAPSVTTWEVSGNLPRALTQFAKWHAEIVPDEDFPDYGGPFDFAKLTVLRGQWPYLRIGDTVTVKCSV
jgi:hypothetical protein